MLNDGQVIRRNPRRTRGFLVGDKAEAARPRQATQEVGPLETILTKSAEKLLAEGKAQTIGGAKGLLRIEDPTLAEAIRK